MKASKIDINGVKRIKIEFPFDKEIVSQIKTIGGARWNPDMKVWHLPYSKIVPNWPGNLDLVKDHFHDRISELIIHEDFEVKTKADQQRRIGTNELLIIRTNAGRLRLIFAFSKELGSVIRKMPFNTWDAKNKWWTIPWSERLLDNLKKAAAEEGLTVLYEEEEKPEGKVNRITPFDIANYRSCPDEYIKKLNELRYSKNTIKTYKALFEEFINYYHLSDIQLIDEKMIIAFIQYLVIERKISLSYQNQSINAIKFYYERVLGGNRKIYLVERPKRDKVLPVVLNEEEIVSTIRQVKNIKHKAVILLIYSAGLRLSECRNLKIKDIDRERMQVFVRQSKGRKDRYTLLSKKVLPVLDQYFDEYHPKEWLFEGEKGEQYSDSSVQTIVKEAYRQADRKSVV